MRRFSSYPLALTLGLLVALAFPLAANAQTAPLRYHAQPYAVDSGVHNGRTTGTAEVYQAFRTTVSVPDAPWLRLAFADVALGAGSYLTVTSLADGAQQRLDAAALAQWQNTTAYFNGDALEVVLHVAPGDAAAQFRTERVIVGEHGAPESQCGPTDDRTASNDPRSGRVLSVGCTGWIIDDGKLVTAGHCMSGSGTVQFNVPPSTVFGGLQHPGPEDQYAVDSGSRVWTAGGVGNDWGVFSVFSNTQTGLQPIDAQGASFSLRQDFGPATIRITGYGVDGGAANQTQQTHTGPNAGSSGTTMRYQADTEGGNSGSPVIDEATGEAVGVHTHGGCSAGSNKGTSTFNTAFWTALGAPVVGEGQISATLTSSTTVPSSGGLVSADVTFSNATSGDFDGEWWALVSYPNGSAGPRLGPFQISLDGGQSVTQTVSKRVPGGAPAGVYFVELRIGQAFPDQIDDSDSFSFFKNGLARPAFGETEAVTWLLDGVAQDGSEAAAKAEAAALLAAYPNPFRGETTVRYALSEAGPVRLAVYDVLGREVALLDDGFREAGTHEAALDGAGLSAGVYFYVLEAGAFSARKRVTLMD